MSETTLYAINPFKMQLNTSETGLIYLKNLAVKPKKSAGVYASADGHYKGRTYNIRIWDEDIINMVKDTNIIVGRVRAESYNETLQIIIESVIAVNIEGVDETYFFDCIDPDYLKGLKTEVLSQIGRYKDLFEELIEPMKNAFESAPAAKTKHDAIIGGLAHHSYKVAKIAISMAKMYGLDHEFIGFCALVHDIGKVMELSPKTIDYTVHGMVQSHISLGIRILNSKKNILDKYLNAYYQAIMFGVVENHHGKEYGGNPTTIEAHIVHLADLADARLTILTEIIKNKIELNETQAATWALDSYFFVGGHEFEQTGKWSTYLSL